MSLASMLSPNGKTGFGGNSTAEDVTAGLQLEGKVILVTGVNSGIGHESMRVLALRGAHVLGTARSLDKAREACASVAGKTEPLVCELADPASVRACVDAVHKLGVKLDAIICNAGIMALPKRQQAFGVELQLFTNHIGHFMLVTGLLDVLADDARVVMLTSNAHGDAPQAGIEFDNLAGERGYAPWRAYGQSKMANLLFAKELARRFAGTNRTANGVHPGVIATNLTRHMNPVAGLIWKLASPFFLKSVGQGAATQVFVAVHPAAASTTGQYWADCNVKAPRADASDEALARRLWEQSEQIVRALP